MERMLFYSSDYNQHFSVGIEFMVTWLIVHRECYFSFTAVKVESLERAVAIFWTMDFTLEVESIIIFSHSAYT